MLRLAMPYRLPDVCRQMLGPVRVRQLGASLSGDQSKMWIIADFSRSKPFAFRHGKFFHSWPFDLVISSVQIASSGADNA